MTTTCVWLWQHNLNFHVWSWNHIHLFIQQTQTLVQCWTHTNILNTPSQSMKVCFLMVGIIDILIVFIEVIKFVFVFLWIFPTLLLIQVLCHFFSWVVFFILLKNSLWIRSLSHYILGNIFSWTTIYTQFCSLHLLL